MEKESKKEYSPELAAAILAYRRQLRFTVFTMIIAVCVAAAATMAWFANNREVSSNGMQTQVAVSSNLVISNDPDTIKTLLNGSSTGDPFTYTFTKAARELIPARHDFTCPTDSAPCAAGLYYNTNPGAVTFNKGLDSNDATTGLTFGAVPEPAENADSPYYEDFHVYIAASGKEFKASSLKAAMTLTPNNGVTRQDYMDAASIDFYLDSVSRDNYLGTLNAVGYDYDTNSQSQKPDLELIGKITDGNIPLNTTGSIHILMRCYFDGGLLKNSTTTFVRSDGLKTGDYTMSVSFTAVDAAS